MSRRSPEKRQLSIIPGLGVFRDFLKDLITEHS